MRRTDLTGRGGSYPHQTLPATLPSNVEPNKTGQHPSVESLVARRSFFRTSDIGGAGIQVTNLLGTSTVGRSNLISETLGQKYDRLSRSAGQLAQESTLLEQAAGRSDNTDAHQELVRLHNEMEKQLARIRKQMDAVQLEITKYGRDRSADL